MSLDRQPPRLGPRRGPVIVLALVALFALLGVGLAIDASPAATRDDQVRAIATTLRCPVCAGEDVADSAAPLAQSMRLVIGEQLDQGRSPAQISEWFALTYGDDVLLEPPARGAGWVMWVLPLLVLAGAGVLLARHWRPGWRAIAVGAGVTVVVLAVWVVPTGAGPAAGGGPATGGSDTSGADARPGGGPAPAADVAPLGDAAVPLAEAAAPLTVLRAGVAELPGSAPLRATLAARLEESGAYGEAAREYAALVRLRPLDPDVRYRQAFALVRGGDTDTARGVLRDALELHEDQPEVLLLLGTLEQSEDPEEGSRLFRRFLDLAPDHPQAGQVRDWLADREEDT